MKEGQGKGQEHQQNGVCRTSANGFPVPRGETFKHGFLFHTTPYDARPEAEERVPHHCELKCMLSVGREWMLGYGNIEWT